MKAGVVQPKRTENAITASHLLIKLLKDRDWDHQAECGRTLDDGTKIYDPELWWPVGRESKDKHWRAAIAVCDQPCPVKWQCLQWAIDNDIRDGIWGGMSPSERAQYALRQRLMEAV